ncbi:MAG: recombinase family protein [Oscillospiraceae bacterium]
MAIIEYLRKSRAEEGMSTEEVLAKHRKALAELAEKKDITITEIYEEVVSGESLYARPEMLRLLDCVRAGGVEAVLCMDIDRLGRGGMADQGIILDTLRLSGTLIVTPDKTYNLNDDSDIEMTEYKAFFARAEWRMIRKRMRRGLMQTIEAGGYVANPPYGYEKCRNGKLPSLRIVEEEAVFIRHIYSRYEAGTGAHIIAAELNAMGSVPRRGSEWNRNTVRHILRNPTFAGKIAWNRVKHQKPTAEGEKQTVTYMPEEEWILVDGLHEPIIPYAEWLSVQEIRKRKYISPNYTGQTANPFSGMIVCGCCGRNMQRMGDNKGLPYLLCNTKGCCAGAQFAYVEDELLDGLHDQLARLKLQLATNAPPDTAALDEALASIDRELKKLDERTPRLYEFLEDGTYDRETFRRRLDAAEKEKAALLEKQSDIRQKLERALRNDTKRLATDLEHVLALYPTLDAGRKNKMLRPIVDKVIYTKYKKTKPHDFTLEIYLTDYYLPISSTSVNL